MTSDFVTEIIDTIINDEGLRRLLIAHSESVARKACSVARKAGLDSEVDMQFLWDASMLHDIGIVECNAPGILCRGTQPYLCHGVEGKKILDRFGLEERYGRVCERHTGTGITKEEIERNHLPLPPKDYMPETLEEEIICYADKFFSKSGDPYREKPIEEVEKSMLRHGEAVLERFRELHRMLNPEGNNDLR